MRGRTSLLLVCVVADCLLAGLAGCGRASGGQSAPGAKGLAAAEPAVVAIDVERAATDPAELGRALLARHQDGASKLGAHRFQGAAQVRVSGIDEQQGAEIEALDEQTTIEVDAAGAWHALYRNSRDYGREVWFADGREDRGGKANGREDRGGKANGRDDRGGKANGRDDRGGKANGTLWLRARYGKYHRRPPVEPDEPGRLLDEVYGTLGAQAELALSALAVTDAGATTVAGRAARRVTLSLGSAGAHRSETLPQREWRETLEVRALAGEVALDTATGALLSGHLTATLVFARNGHRYELRVTADHTISDVGAAVGITPPGDAESVDTPGRSRDFDDRAELLEGIASPAPRAPTPHDPGGAK